MHDGFFHNPASLQKSKDQYDQVYEDIPFEIKTGKNCLDLACCDCGLVHKIGINVVKNNKIRMTFNVDSRETKKRRAKGLGKLFEGHKNFLIVPV